VKTDEEIEAELEKGDKFVKEHPYSMFGTDNRILLRLFERVIKMVKKKGIDEAEQEIEDFYEDDEQAKAFDIIDWLRGDLDEDFW